MAPEACACCERARLLRDDGFHEQEESRRAGEEEEKEGEWELVGDDYGGDNDILQEKGEKKEEEEEEEEEGEGVAILRRNGNDWPSGGRTQRQGASNKKRLKSATNIMIPRSRTRDDVDGTARRRKAYAMALLTVTTVCMMADQNLLSPNLTAVADDFNFTKKERDQKLGGQLAAAFFLVGVPSSLVIGHLSDTRNRIIVFAAVVLVGEAPCFATFWVRTYSQLLVLRALTGISVGGVLPLLYSVLGDLFAAEHRSLVSAALATAAGIGIAVGQAIAGFVGPTYGWRLPFVIVSVPTVLFALLTVCTVTDPRRGEEEKAIKDVIGRRGGEGGDGKLEYKERIDRSKLVDIFRVWTNVIIFVQGVPGCVPWGVVFTYFNDFLHDDKGQSVEMATGVTLWFGIGAAIGNVVGGIAGQYLYNVNKNRLSYLMGITTILGALPMCLVINMSASFLEKPGGTVLAIFSVFTSGVLACVTGANVRVLVLNVNVPEVRGTVFSIYNLSDDLGKGIGPFVVSFLIVLMGRVRAFNVAMSLWVVTGILLLLTSFTIDRDVESMQSKLADVAAKLEREQERTRERGDMYGSTKPSVASDDTEEEGLHGDEKL